MSKATIAAIASCLVTSFLALFIEGDYCEASAWAVLALANYTIGQQRRALDEMECEECCER